MMVVFFAILYALGSMVLGGMLVLARVPGGYSWAVLWGNALGNGSWNYPGFWLVAPWGFVYLPFLATWSMVVISVGVGIGISVAVLITVRLLRDRKRAAAQPGAIGSLAGLTPAMIALVTLGACCSTTAAATAGVGLVAQASGTSLNNLLVNNWYLDVFQVTVVGIALFAQEMILEVYGGLLGFAAPTASHDAAYTGPRSTRLQWLAGGALRGALLVGGVTWSLAMVAEWTTTNPIGASPTLWFQWIFQHQVVAIFAIVLALFPREISSAFSRSVAGPSSKALRAVMLVAGISLVGWLPPVVAGSGAPGFINELLGLGGLPASWGAVAPVFGPGITLWLRWGFQYLLLGGFAIVVALAPDRAFVPIRWTLGPPGDPDGEDASTRSTAPVSLDSAGVLSFESLSMTSEPTSSARGVRDP
jgi:hypothetical protein